MNMWPDTKEFFDVVHEHSEEIQPQMKIILFAGIGNFIKSYNDARHETNNPKISFAIALEKVTQNPAINLLMASQLNRVIDGKVEEMM
tara:strand:- start:461 stop:724 length:264 start_codon:yes stop_codon:yes gene_type:complete